MWVGLAQPVEGLLSKSRFLGEEIPSQDCSARPCLGFQAVSQILYLLVPDTLANSLTFFVYL